MIFPQTTNNKKKYKIFVKIIGGLMCFHTELSDETETIFEKIRKSTRGRKNIYFYYKYCTKGGKFHEK